MAISRRWTKFFIILVSALFGKREVMSFIAIRTAGQLHFQITEAGTLPGR